MKITQFFFLVVYYAIAKHLPRRKTPLLGSFSMWLRKLCCKHIFASCGDHVRIQSGVHFGPGDRVHLGDYISIGADCTFLQDGDIYIGNKAILAPQVMLVTTDHRIARDKPIWDQETVTKPIHIGDDVFIGFGSLILKGVKIGQGAVVAAGSIVTKDVPPYTVVGGNPAQVIKKRE